MEILASKLYDKLQVLSLGIAKKANSWTEDCITFYDGKAKTFANDIYIETACDIGFEGYVRYDSFARIIKGYGNNDIQFESNGDYGVVIKRGRSKTTIQTRPVYDNAFKHVPEIDEGEWIPAPPTFVAQLKALCSAHDCVVGADLTHYINVCSDYFEVACSTQTMRQYCKLNIPNRFLVNYKAISSLVKKSWFTADGKDVLYQYKDGWFFLLTRQATIGFFTSTEEYFKELDTYYRDFDEELSFPDSVQDDVTLLCAVAGDSGDVTIELSKLAGCIMSASSKNGSHRTIIPMKVQKDRTLIVRASTLKTLITPGNCYYITQKGSNLLSMGNTYGFMASASSN